MKWNLIVKMTTTKKIGESAKAILNSPNNPELHTIEKERQHKTRENFKTLYGSYEDSDSKEPQIAAEDLLKAIVKHINREFIDAFYKERVYSAAKFFRGIIIADVILPLDEI